MKAKVKFKFKNVSELIGDSNMGIITLVDEQESRQIAIPCDKDMIAQFTIRLSGLSITQRFVPEVLWNIIHTHSDFNYEIIIDDIKDGEYRCLLYNVDTLEPTKIRASDGVLLSMISGIPIYIELSLVQHQSVAYNGEESKISLPVNAISDDMIRVALDKAVSNEDYELASRLRDELNRRSK